MIDITNEKIIGKIDTNDKLSLVPHRLLSLGKNKIAVISEKSNGWLIANTDDYLHMKDLFSQKEIIFNSAINKNENDLLNLLLHSNLLEKNGACISDIIRPFSPILLVLKITGDCNFNCSYCYDYSSARTNTVIPISKVKETISFILSKKRGINLIMHGGEPLLHFPLIKNIVEFATKEAGESNLINFFIQTNGSLFNKEIVAFLDKHDFRVGLSLDGMTEHANTYRSVKSGLSCLEIFNKNIKEYGDFLRRRSGVLCTLSKLNIEEFPNFALWLQELKINSVTANLLTGAGKGTQVEKNLVSAEEYIELNTILMSMIKKKEIDHIAIGNINNFISSLIKIRDRDLCHSNPCGAGRNFLVIDSKGNYRACDCLYHDYFLLENKTANIFQKRVKILNRLEHMKNNACANCAIFGLCGGGCVSEAIATTGTAIDLPERNCKVKKFFYKTLLKEFAFDKERTLFEYYASFNQQKKLTTQE